MIIDKNIQKPIYLQLKELIMEQITAGKLAPGSKLMSESEISKEYDISRVTVRKAFSEMVDEGYLVRKQGKGTYVMNIHYSESLRSNSFTSTCRVLGFVPSSKIVNLGFVPATEKDIEWLHAEPGGQVAYMERLRYADGIPVRLERNYYADSVKSIIEEDLETQSIIVVLSQKYGIRDVSHLKFIIEIGYANKIEAELLGIKKSTPLLKAEGLLCDHSNGNTLYRTELLHLPDRCILEV